MPNEEIVGLVYEVIIAFNKLSFLFHGIFILGNICHKLESKELSMFSSP